MLLVGFPGTLRIGRKKGLTGIGLSSNLLIVQNNSPINRSVLANWFSEVEQTVDYETT